MSGQSERLVAVAEAVAEEATLAAEEVEALWGDGEGADFLGMQGMILSTLH